MNSITKLDEYISESRIVSVNFLAKALEAKDKELVSEFTKTKKLRSNFKIIGIRERSLLTTIGTVVFKRHYMKDIENNKYFFPLDEAIELPKRSRLSNELKIDIFKKSSDMSYPAIIRQYENFFSLSRSSIYRTISKTKVTQTLPKYDVGNLKVHVQVDEKYVGLIESKNKKRLYTCTIYAGCETTKPNARKLKNKFCFSTLNLLDLPDKINFYLLKIYGLTVHDSIFLSGDFAPYIRNLQEKIFCGSKYVPDKWHVGKLLKDFIPNGLIKISDLNNPITIDILGNLLKDSEDKNAINFRKIILNNPNIFSSYNDPEYIGCSQEGFHARLYCPKFSNRMSRFSKNNLSKIALFIESRFNKTKIKITNKDHFIEKRDFGIYKFDYPIEEKNKKYINTDNFTPQTRKLFNYIIYGDKYNG